MTILAGLFVSRRYVPYLMVMQPQTAGLTDRPRAPTILERSALTPEMLCEKYAERVYRFAAMVARGGAEAEDIAQDALERAIRRLGGYDPARGSIDGWLWRIVVRAAADSGRAELRRTRIFERLVAWRGPSEDVVEQLDDGVTDDALLEAVRALKTRDRTMVALRFGSDLSYGEIGALLGIREAAVGVAVRRALARLRASSRVFARLRASSP